MSASIRKRFTAVVAALSIGLTGTGLASAQESLIAPPSATADQQETLPAALGGSQHGTTEQTLDIQGYGAITATLNNDTGLLTTTLPDGSTRTTSFEEAAASLQDALDNPPANATSEISAVPEVLQERHLLVRRFCRGHRPCRLVGCGDSSCSG